MNEKGIAIKAQVIVKEEVILMKLSVRWTL